MNENMNCQWRIAARPVGNVKPSDFEYREEPIPSPGDGEMLLKTLYLGLAPLMRMYMQGIPTAGERPQEIGDVIHGRGVAEVIKSKHPDYRPGDVVQGQVGWQTYKVTKATPKERFFRCKDYGLSYALCAGVMGMTGLSAYGGFIDCGKPEKDDVVVVSGAAGGVGSIVIQMAKIMCARVIGIAGGAEKCAAIKALGCDEAIDYKNEDIPAALARHCPDGIDLYFDNVGGAILSACLDRLAMHARIVLCGSISEYLMEERTGPANYTNLRRVNGSMNGFFVYNYIDLFEKATDQFAEWIQAGKMKPVQDMAQGFEAMPDALARLYDGRNIGVQCCQVRGELTG
jgi:NADPH-dependent curcumin reductase CurA